MKYQSLFGFLMLCQSLKILHVELSICDILEILGLAEAEKRNSN